MNPWILYKITILSNRWDFKRRRRRSQGVQKFRVQLRNVSIDVASFVNKYETILAHDALHHIIQITSQYFLLYFSDHRRCPSNDGLRQESRYFLSTETYSWGDANQYCKKHKATLVEFLHHQFTQNAKEEIKKLTNSNIPLWLAAKSYIENFNYRQSKATVKNITKG